MMLKPKKKRIGRKILDNTTKHAKNNMKIEKKYKINKKKKKKKKKKITKNGWNRK